MSCLCFYTRMGLKKITPDLCRFCITVYLHSHDSRSPAPTIISNKERSSILFFSSEGSRISIPLFRQNCLIPRHLFACRRIRTASIMLCFIRPTKTTVVQNGGVFSSYSHHPRRDQFHAFATPVLGLQVPPFSDADGVAYLFGLLLECSSPHGVPKFFSLGKGGGGNSLRRSFLVEVGKT